MQAHSYPVKMAQRITELLSLVQVQPLPSFHIRGPQPRGCHLGRKWVPRFYTRTRSMVLPQMGQGSPPLNLVVLLTNLKEKTGINVVFSTSNT